MSKLKLVWMGLGESGIVKEGGRNRVVKSWNSPPVAHGGGRQSSQAFRFSTSRRLLYLYDIPKASIGFRSPVFRPF